MALRIPLPIVFLWAVVLAGCGTPTDPAARLVVDGRAHPCVDEPGQDPETYLQCPEAIRLAGLRLGLRPGEASALEFHRGEGCEPLGEQPRTDCGAVVAWFASKPPIMVRILPFRSGGFATQDLESPPQALIDRGPAGTSPPP